jgi:hypothetical protein
MTEYTESTQGALERIATAPCTSEQGLDRYQQGRDDQLRECCDVVREDFAHLGLQRSQALANVLYSKCRPKKASLKEQLLQLLQQCPPDEDTAALRAKIEKLPDDFLSS